MDNKFIGLVIGLVIGVLLIGTLMAPVIDDIQKTSGDKITKTNESLINDRADYYDEDVTVVISSPTTATTGADVTLTINNYSVSTANHPLTVPIFMSDSVYLQINSSGSAASAGIYRINQTGLSPTNGNFNFGHEYTISFDYSDKTMSMVDKNLTNETSSTVVSDIPVSFFFSIKENGKYLLTRETASGGVTAFKEMFVNMAAIDDHTLGVFRDSNSVTVGETSVSYVAVASKNGISVIVNNTGYSGVGEVTVSGLDVASGTTDIYTGGTPSLTVTITNDETGDSASKTITPEASWCLAEASGHATSGAAYSLYGVFVVLFIVAVLMFAVSYVINRD